MLTNGSNQYIQPDYLSPLPTTLDSKRSPLALLAQTCSQIGADPTPSCSTTTTATTTSSVTKSVDKQSKKLMNDHEKTAKTPPQSKHDNRQETKEIESKSGFKSPTIKSSSSPVIHCVNQLHDNGTKLMAEQRIALDMAMQQQQQFTKDIQQSMLANYRPSAVFSSPMSSLAHHPLSAYHHHHHHPGLAGLDAATAAALAAFRHPAYSSYPHHVPVSFGLASYHQQALSAVSSYGQRLQHHSNNKNNDTSSMCRDPYCTTCPNNSPAPPVSSPNNNSPKTTTTSSSCPAGCTQCDHVTRTTSTSMMLMNNTTATSTTSVSSSSTSSTTTPIVTSAPDTTSALLRAYVCNWIAGDHYCGKRFTSSEELLQHLRTHTSLSSTPSVEPSLHPHSAHLLAASALHRTYPTPPLSPLSMARYHPYNAANKHLNSNAALQHSATAAAAPSPLMSLHHPYAAANLAGAGLSGYYSTHPYSLYSQRMLAGSGVLP